MPADINVTSPYHLFVAAVRYFLNRNNDNYFKRKNNKLNVMMKLEAIILAAGSGSSMLELTRSKPKCLLTVGNHCLIWFAITGLRTIGVSKITILVPDLFENEIKQYCHKKFFNLKDLAIEFATITTKEDWGTAESILSVKDKIKRDFIVYSCDTIIDPKALSYLVNHYRLYDPVLTMLLSDQPKYFEARSVPSRREKERYTRDIIGIEPLDKLNLTASNDFSANKIVFIESERDLRQNFKLRSKELALHPSLEVNSRYLDSHVYIFKHQMLDFMNQNRDKVVLKGEMIPLLIAKQFSKITKRNDSDNLDDDDDVNDDIRNAAKRHDYEYELREKLENFNPKNVNHFTHFKRVNLPDNRNCHAVVVRNLIAHRVNTIGTFLDSNREAKTILSHYGAKNLNSFRDSPIGESTTIGDKCTIKSSSIGNNCQIGDKVKMLDCVIMDNVVIESNANLKECIISNYSKIGSKCDLKSCIIGQRQVLPEGRKFAGEAIMDDEYVIDLSKPIKMDDDVQS